MRPPIPLLPLLPLVLLASLAACADPAVPTEPGEQNLIAGPRPARASAVAQLFDWPFEAITGELCALRDDGFSHVHVSPPQLSNRSPRWWGRYQPDDWRVIAGPLGDEAAFRAMLEEAERCEIDVVVDAVLNHMANFRLPEGELYFPAGCDRRRPYDSGPGSCLFGPEHFHPARCIADYGDPCDVLDGRICGGGGDPGLPDLRTGRCGPRGFDPFERNYDPHVFAMARAYLLRLEAMGARAFRIDAAKHLHPAFLRDLLADPAVRAGMDWAYAEIITDRPDDRILQAYADIEDLDFMDFPLARHLERATSPFESLGGLEFTVSSGRALPGERSVSFVTNHDVWGNEDGLGYRFGGEERWPDERLAHAFLFGRAEGIPYVYSELPERSESRRYRRAETSYVLFHRRPFVRAMARWHARLLGEPTRPRWQDPLHLALARGDRGLVVLNKSAEPWAMGFVDVGLSDGLFEDVLSGARVRVRGGRADLVVPGRDAVMLERLAGR